MENCFLEREETFNFRDVENFSAEAVLCSGIRFLKNYVSPCENLTKLNFDRKHRAEEESIQFSAKILNDDDFTILCNNLKDEMIFISSL